VVVDVDLRRETFTDRTQYFIDCAQEGWELDSGSALALELYGDEAAIKEVINAPGALHPDSHYRNRRVKCLRLVAMADDIIDRLPAGRRSGIAHRSLHYVTHGIRELAETMSYWTIEDEIDGGCMEPYRDRSRSRNGITNKATARRLLAPSFIRRCVKKHAPSEADHLRDLHAVAMRRAARDAPQRDPDLMAFYRAQIAAAQPRYDRIMAAAFPHHRHALPVPRKQRKVIRRSLNIATSLLGIDTVKAFLSGEEIRLVGREAMLMLRKRGRLAARGHGCLSVAVADRNGTTLADLCTYIDGTPTLDQLCGFALWMRAGEERAVMETANITKLADGAAEHPLIAHHYAVRRAARAETPDPVGRAIRSYLTHDQKMARAATYWDRTREHWIAALSVAVIGHRNFHLYRTAGAM
jgi:hypothetical protein